RKHLTTEQLVQRVTVARQLTLGSLGLLIGAIAGRMLSGSTSLLMLLPALLPLLIFVPGAWRSDPRSLALLCFVCLLYFCVITVRLFAPDRTAFDVIAMIAVVTLFVAAMLFTRWRKQQLRDTNAAGDSRSE
ncbi:MAG: DUF2069 domain-containing protein, partial [Porticoccaceae bacterium]